MLVTLSLCTAICQSIAEIEWFFGAVTQTYILYIYLYEVSRQSCQSVTVGVAPLRAVSQRFTFVEFNPGNAL